MAGANRYRGSNSRRRKGRGGGWLLLAFCLLCALLLRYGKSEPLIRLRQQASAWLAESEVYEQAVAEVGKLFSGESEQKAASVFGQLFFGEEPSEETKE